MIGQMALEVLIRPSIPMGSSDPQQIWAGWKNFTADNVKQSCHHSPWKGIVQVLRSFTPFSKLSPGSGRFIRCWLDPWICSSPLDSRFPRLFNLHVLEDGFVSSFFSPP